MWRSIISLALGLMLAIGAEHVEAHSNKPVYKTIVAPDFVALYEATKPTIVLIRTEYDVAFRGRVRAWASGVVLSSQASPAGGFTSFIITNDHVVTGAKDITAELASREHYPAEVVGYSDLLDLAVIKIRTPKKIPVAVVGDPQSLKVGHPLYAIGNPYGLKWKLSVGFVGKLGDDLSVKDFIVFDGAVHPGNSGGGLFNVSGELVGIMAEADFMGGIGFAVSSLRVKDILPALLKGGRVAHGFLGIAIVSLENVTASFAKENGLSYPLPGEEGAIVLEVYSGSPAAKAGFLKGDIIVEANGQQIVGATQLQWLVALSSPGKSITMRIRRHNGREVNLSVTLSSLPARAPSARP